MKEQDAAHSMEHDECEFYLDNEAVVFGCECGNIEIGGKLYYPEEKLTLLRSELQQERELRKECIALLDNVKDDMIEDGNPNLWMIQQIDSLIKKLNNETTKSSI